MSRGIWEFLDGLFCSSLCGFFAKLLGLDEESEREVEEARRRRAYRPPRYVPTPRSAAEREATRTKIRERVAARRARDAQRRNER